MTADLYYNYMSLKVKLTKEQQTEMMSAWNFIGYHVNGPEHRDIKDVNKFTKLYNILLKSYKKDKKK